MANITLDDIDVLVEFRNRDLEKTGERRYAIKEYAEYLQGNLERILCDVENAMRLAHKEPDYDPRKDETFLHIRKNILNASNAIARLPSNIRCNGEYIENRSVSSFIAQIFNR